MPRDRILQEISSSRISTPTYPKVVLTRMYQSCYWSWGSEETPQRRIGRLWCRRVVQITCEGQVIGWNGSRIAFVSGGNGSLLMLNAQNSCEIWSISFSSCDKRWSWAYGIQAMTLDYLSHKKKKTKVISDCGHNKEICYKSTKCNSFEFFGEYKAPSSDFMPAASCWFSISFCLENLIMRWRSDAACSHASSFSIR